ncbi:hypothetical protein [Solicola sp. PLA-1-18]|uniref:hypothetical protein n=1 Tax=Solicola sp. PLA-1-18 TaxID=3380532 RepID=UPI003B7FD8DA
MTVFVPGLLGGLVMLAISVAMLRTSVGGWMVKQLGKHAVPKSPEGVRVWSVKAVGAYAGFLGVVAVVVSFLDVKW